VGVVVACVASAHRVLDVGVQVPDEFDLIIIIIITTIGAPGLDLDGCPFR
jgi:hypothetical protein